MRLTVRILSVAAAATLLGACSSGADTKTEYIDVVDAANANAFDAFNQIVNATSGKREETVEQLEAGESSLAESINDLESVDVPEEAEARHADLLADFTELQELFQQAASDAKKATGTEVFSVLSELASKGRVIGDRIGDTLNKINQDLDTG